MRPEERDTPYTYENTYPNAGTSIVSIDMQTKNVNINIHMYTCVCVEP